MFEINEKNPKKATDTEEPSESSAAPFELKPKAVPSSQADVGEVAGFNIETKALTPAEPNPEGILDAETPPVNVQKPASVQVQNVVEQPGPALSAPAQPSSSGLSGQSEKKDAESQRSEKSAQTVFWLMVFLPFTGAHYFYLGQPKKGLLFFFTLGGCTLWLIIDFARLLTGVFTDANGLNLKK